MALLGVAGMMEAIRAYALLLAFSLCFKRLSFSRWPASVFHNFGQKRTWPIPFLPPGAPNRLVNTTGTHRFPFSHIYWIALY